MKKGAEKMLLNYVRKHIEEIEEVSEVEYRLEFPKDKSTITGKVDVIMEKNGGVEVREYKTSMKITKPEQVALQVKLYALGLKGLGFKVERGSVVYLDESELHNVEVDEESLGDAKKQAEQILLNLRNQSYDAKLGDFCENCDYKKICRWEKEEVNK